MQQIHSCTTFISFFLFISYLTRPEVQQVLGTTLSTERVDSNKNNVGTSYFFMNYKKKLSLN